MNVLLIDNGSTYITELKRLLGKHNITHVKNNAANAQTASHYDLVVLSGGHAFSVANHAHIYERELDIIKNCNRPIIGVCLGFQLIAHAFGGTLKHLDHDEHGLRSIETIEDSDIFEGIDKDNVQVYEAHHWYVESVPGILEVLAKSEAGIEIVHHLLKPIYGFQFHPEIHSRSSQGDEIFLNTIKLVEERVYNE
jgi:GMP synthase (glutamine-hydrolysing)